MQESNKITTSIIICTYNRCKKLEILLNSLERLSLDENLTYEIIIVDNNSTDDTKDIVTKFSERTFLKIRYVFEANQGQGYARNKGVEEARGEILVFTDDDCIPDNRWVLNISKRFELEPSLSGLGGRVELYDTRDRPMTIRTSREVTEFSSPHQIYIPVIPGCNMAFRKEVFEAIGVFDPVFGAGTKIGTSEDSDFLYRVYRKGLKVKYFPDIMVYHNHGRRTDAQVKTLAQSYVCGRGAFYCKYILRGDPVIIKLALHEGLSVMRSLIKNPLTRKSIQRQRRRTWWLTLGIIRGFPIFLRRGVASWFRPPVGSTR